MARLVSQVALVSEMDQDTLSFSELSQVSAALQKQVTRDFGPIWQVLATVDAFTSLDDVPLGYWPVVIMEDIGDPSAAGFHQDDNGNPFALVQFSESWSLTASHETLEMLADPFGNRVVATSSPAPNSRGRAEILVEVCDPSEDVAFAYTVNGVTVSDFYTPRYFDSVASSGVRYSFTNAIKKPRQVLKGGYVSFHDLRTNHWMQVVFFGARPQVRDLGVLSAAGGVSVRAQIDRLTVVEEFVKGFKKSEPTLAASRSLLKAAATDSNTKAEAWRAQIRQLTTKR